MNNKREPLNVTVASASSAIALSLAADHVVHLYLAALLRADGQAISGLSAVIDRFVDLLVGSGAVTTAMTASVRIDDELRSCDIRTFFLNPQVSYSLHELATLWRMSLDDVIAAFADELQEWQCVEKELPPALMRVMWHDAIRVATQYNLIPSSCVEHALGVDFTRVRPDSWRTRPVFVRLPEWLIERIEREPMIPASADLAQRIENILVLCIEAESYIPQA